MNAPQAINPQSTRRAALLLAWLALLVLGGCASQPAPREAPQYSVANDAAHAGVTEALYNYYSEWRGVPYRYGGVDRSGIDCSSFVRQTLSDVESLNLPRTTRAQSRAGEPVPRGDLSPGDLVFFKTGYRSRHVGIYVGGGRFMHASTSQGVTMSRLDNVYWRRHYWQSRRLPAQTR